MKYFLVWELVKLNIREEEDSCFKQNTKVKQVFTILQEMKYMSVVLGVPIKVVQIAGAKCKQFFKKTNKSVKKLKAVASVFLYITCQKQNVDITFKQISDVSRATKKDIQNCYTEIIKSFRSTKKDKETCSVMNDHISRISNLLELSNLVKEFAYLKKKHYIEVVSDKGIYEAFLISAAFVYIAAVGKDEVCSQLTFYKKVGC